MDMENKSGKDGAITRLDDMKESLVLEFRPYPVLLSLLLFIIFMYGEFNSIEASYNPT